MHYIHLFETASGYCGLAWQERRITRLELPGGSERETMARLVRRIGHVASSEPPEPVRAVIVSIQRYFAGERTEFADVEVDLGSQGRFAADIYAATRRLGWGQTTTYGALASEFGAGPEAARAVGQTMAKNPIPLIIPCHRVLAAGGKLGGFSAPGGGTTKRHMLDLEGVRLACGQSAQMELGL